MRLQAAFSGLLLLALACSSGASEGTPSDQNSLAAQAQAADTGHGELIMVPSDAAAQYFILERGGTSALPTLLTKRVGPSGTSYSKRVFDCAARTVKYLGDGDTIADVAASTPDATMAPLVDGSIADVLWQEACRKS